MNVDDYINREELNDRLDGDMDLFRELTEIFLNDSVSLLEKIDSALSSGDATMVGKTAHTLKGAVSNFSATRAFEAALNLEKIGKTGDLSKAPEAFEKLKIEVENLKAAMNELMGKSSIL